MSDMMFPDVRLRRLRQSERMRNLVSETRLHPDQLILPLFFDANIDKVKTTGSMPGVPTYPLSGYEDIAGDIQGAGVNSVLLFGVPSHKDPLGSGAWERDGVVQKAIRGLKESSDMIVIADLCLCEYTDHGHCGALDSDGSVKNDETIGLYGRTAVSQADAGADIIAPSGMMAHHGLQRQVPQRLLRPLQGRGLLRPRQRRQGRVPDAGGQPQGGHAGDRVRHR